MYSRMRRFLRSAAAIGVVSLSIGMDAALGAEADFPDLSGRYENVRAVGGLISLVVPPPEFMQVDQVFGGVVDAEVNFGPGAPFPPIRNTIIGDGRVRFLYDFEFGTVVQAYRRAQFVGNSLVVEQINILPTGNVAFKRATFTKVDENRLRFTASVYGIVLIDVIGERVPPWNPPA